MAHSNTRSLSGATFMQDQPRAMTGAALTRPETQVEREVSELQLIHKELIEQCQSLRQRLRCVLRDNPNKDGGGSTPRELLVPLAEQLREVKDMTQSAMQVLSDIGNSLELPFNETISAR